MSFSRRGSTASNYIAARSKFCVIYMQHPLIIRFCAQPLLFSVLVDDVYPMLALPSSRVFSCATCCSSLRCHASIWWSHGDS